MIKHFQTNGTISIPKKLRQQLPSDEVDVKITEINGKKVIVLEPIKEDKTPTVIYN